MKFILFIVQLPCSKYIYILHKYINYILHKECLEVKVERGV